MEWYNILKNNIFKLLTLKNRKVYIVNENVVSIMFFFFLQEEITVTNGKYAGNAATTGATTPTT